MHKIFFIIIVFLSSLGLLYFFNLLQNIFLNDSEDIKNSRNFRIIPLSGKTENIEYIVRNHASREKNKKSFEKTDLIFVDISADPETKKILKNMSSTYNFTICGKEEIYAIIKNKLDF